MGQGRSPGRTEPRALPPTKATGNLSAKAQVAGGRARGPEASRLLTLEHSGSGTPAQTTEDAAEPAAGHPCPVLELPPPWPLGCGPEDVPAFCFICFHREEEEELLEEVPLQRSVPLVGSGWTGLATWGPWGLAGLRRSPSVYCLPSVATSLHQTLRSPTCPSSVSPVLDPPGPSVLSRVVMASCSEPALAPGSRGMKWTLSRAFGGCVI